jgi:hypothetical protein
VVEKWILGNNTLGWFDLVCGAKCHFQQYFSNIVVVSFIGGGYREKTTNLSQVTDKLYHIIIMLYRVHLTMNRVQTYNSGW